MRSAAAIRGHPIHPMLVPFPLAFLTGAFLFDLIGTWRDRPEFWVAGYYLAVAGVACALLAALPGAIDYFRAIPRATLARHHARRHALLNLSAVALFALATWLRGSAGVPPDPVLVAFQGVAVLLLAGGGWLGGELVYKLGVGVDPRPPASGTDLRQPSGDDVDDEQIRGARP